MSKKKSSQRLKREVVRVEGQVPGIRSAEERSYFSEDATCGESMFLFWYLSEFAIMYVIRHRLTEII